MSSLLLEAGARGSPSWMPTPPMKRTSLDAVPRCSPRVVSVSSVAYSQPALVRSLPLHDPTTQSRQCCDCPMASVSTWILHLMGRCGNQGTYNSGASVALTNEGMRSWHSQKASEVLMQGENSAKIFTFPSSFSLHSAKSTSLGSKATLLSQALL